MGIQNVVRWASVEVNYPGSPSGAQPWLGGPVSVAPASDYWNPNFKPPAQNFNYLFAKEDAQAAYAYNLAVSVAVGNWSAQVNVSSFTIVTPIGWGALAWDALYGRWLGVITDQEMAVNKFAIVQTNDGGRTWPATPVFLSGNLSTTSSFPIAMTVSPNGTIFVLESAPATTQAHGISGGVDTVTALFSGSTVGTAFLLGPTYIWTYYVKQTAGTYVGKLARGDQFSASVWVDESATLPATASNFASGTNHVGAILSATGQVGGTPIGVVVMCGATAGTDTARMMSVSVAAGVPSPTEITPSFFATHRQVTGIAYSPNDGLWGVAIFDGSGTSYIFTSPDLLTWTQVFTTALGEIQGLAVVGNVWATSINNGISTHVLISGNVGTLLGASTWSATSSNLAIVADAFTAGLYSNGNQLLASTDTLAMVSLQVGFAKDGPSGPFAQPFANQGSGARSVLIYADVAGVMPNAGTDFAVGFKSLSANRSVQLPANPAIGQSISVTDLDGSLAAHTFTIDGNGKNVQGAATYVLSNTQGPRASVTLIFFSATDGWCIT